MKVIVVWSEGWGPHGVKHPCGTVIELDGFDLSEALRIGLVAEAPAATATPPVLETAAVAPPRNAAKRTSKPAPRKKS